MRGAGFRTWVSAFEQPFTYMGLALLVLAAAALFYFTGQEKTRAYDAAVTKSEADARIFEEYIARRLSNVVLSRIQVLSVKGEAALFSLGGDAQPELINFSVHDCGMKLCGLQLPLSRPIQLQRGIFA